MEIKEKIKTVEHFEEVVKKNKEDLSNIDVFINILNGKYCEADKYVTIDIKHTRDELTGIYCNTEVAVKFLKSIRKDVENRVKDFELALEKAKKELKEIL